MKKNLFLLVFMLQLLFAVSVRAASSLTFKNVYPSIADGTETYQQTVIVSSDLEATSVVYSLGTAVGVTADIDASTGKLSNIKGNGAIQVKATCGTVTADYVLTVAYAIHEWNFITERLTLTPGDRLGANPGELDVPNGETDWGTSLYNLWKVRGKNGSDTKEDGTAPLYAYRGQVQGDNALIVKETAGLQFLCDKQNFGVVNNSKGKVNRNVKFNAGSTLIIPQLKKGQYVMIWCNPYSSPTYQMSASNVTDLEDDPIEGNVLVTGCVVEASGNTLKKLYGATCFKVKEDGDVSFKSVNAWNDICKIRVANEFKSDLRLAAHLKSLMGESISPEKSNHTTLAGEEYLISGFPQETGAMNGKYPSFAVVEGADLVKAVSVKDGNFCDFKVVGIKGKYGKVKIIQKILCPGEKNYVLDKAESWIAVGDIDKQDYPYTWDFTGYNSNWDGDGNSKGTQLGNSTEVESHGGCNVNGLSVFTTDADGLHVPLFAKGSQLTDETGANPIKETKGLGIVLEKENMYGSKANNMVRLGKATGDTETSLQMGATNNSVNIPQVDAGMYIFIRADKQPDVKYSVDDSSVASSSDAFQLQEGVYAFHVEKQGDIKVSDVNKIYAIAVTDQVKKMNEAGRTTDSRAVAIDYSETQKYTKDKLTAYAVYENVANSYLSKDKDVTLLKMSEVSVAGANTGVVLWDEHEEKKEVNVPLFVPAMNIDAKDAWADSPLQPNVEETKMPASDAHTSYYVYTNRYFTTSNPNYQTGKQYLFYQVNKAGTLAANKAYLRIDNVNSSSAKQNILLSFDKGETTSIDKTLVKMQPTSDDYYTLSGLKISGKPSQRGVYIHKGKKVVVR